MSRLGPHVILPTAAALAWVQKAPVVKVLDQGWVFHQARPDAVKIFRHFFPSQDINRNGADVADEVVRSLGDGPATHIELFNEVASKLGEGLERHVTMTAEAVAHLAHERPDLTVIGYSIATGNIEQADWDYLRAHNFGGVTVVGWHHYFGNQGFTQWEALRYRTYWRPGDPLIAITEAGRDRVEGGKGGWQADGLSAEQFAAEVNAFVTETAKDPQIIAVTPFTSGPTKDWAPFNMDPIGPLLSPTPPPQPQHQGGTVPADFTSPNHEGPRTQTLGIVIHATFGNSATAQTEYTSTCDYFQNPAPGGDPRKAVSAHAVAGPGGAVHRPVKPDLIAWHCSASNKTHLGIEMAKPRLGDAIASDILDGAAQVVARWCQDYKIPIVWNTAHGLAEHHEMPTNVDGHSDVGGPFDRNDFLARVKKYAQGDELTDAQRTAVLDDLGLIWGMAKADTIRANPAESERAIHERVVAIKVALGING